MSLFQDYAACMRAQDNGATVEAYQLPLELVRRLRHVLLNFIDEESDFFLGCLKIEAGQPHATVQSHLAHHLYDYLQGQDT
jgi:hypothetical protein